jgi:hypothetical protein
VLLKGWRSGCTVKVCDSRHGLKSVRELPKAFPVLELCRLPWSGKTQKGNNEELTLFLRSYRRDSSCTVLWLSIGCHDGRGAPRRRPELQGHLRSDAAVVGPKERARGGVQAAPIAWRSVSVTSISAQPPPHPPPLAGLFLHILSSPTHMSNGRRSSLVLEVPLMITAQSAAKRVAAGSDLLR